MTKNKSKRGRIYKSSLGSKHSFRVQLPLIIQPFSPVRINTHSIPDLKKVNHILIFGWKNYAVFTFHQRISVAEEGHAVLVVGDWTDVDSVLPALWFLTRTIVYSEMSRLSC